MICDEATNFKIDGLPALLTLAREYKIVIWLILQELEQWAHLYGRESLSTVLSQTEVKLFMGVRSHAACQLISDMLGETSLKTMNHNIGETFFDPVTRSITEGGRRVMTPDEVRRCTDLLLFIREHRPMKLEAIGYHEISPWRSQVAINPLFNKKFKGKIKLRSNPAV